jgi:gliding motility-associated-like protein
LKKLILILQFFVLGHVMAQKEYANWYFGDSAAVSFISGSPVSIKGSNMSTIEGCSSISDENGNLLFYTNGVYVWNKEHRYMDQLFANGLLLGGGSSTQSALIVQQPRSKQFYYIFTTNNLENVPYDYGVNYSVVDMFADSGRGSIVVKNQFLIKGTCEKIAATLAANKEDIWIAAPQLLTDTLFVFKLGKNGLSSKVIKQNTGRVMDRPGYSYNYVLGQMKFSPNGKHLVYGVGTNHYQSEEVYLFDFNTENGLISNSRLIQTNIMPYGLEFSPNSQYLFLGTRIGFCQVKVSKIKPIQDIDSNFRKLSLGNPNGLQLGPDGRIYHANDARKSLSCIENPDSFGSACTYKRDILTLNFGKCFFTLPGMVSSLVIPQPNIVTDTTCVYDSAVFYVQYKTYDSLKWDFGDGQFLQSKVNIVKHKYRDSGLYQITLIGHSKGLSDTLKKQIYIHFMPSLNLGNDTILCYGDSLKLLVKSKAGIKLLWNDFTNAPNKTIKQNENVWLEYSDQFCKLKDSISVKFGKKFKVYIGNDTAFCHQFQYVLKPNKPYKTYKWNTGDSTNSISVNNKGEYVLNVRDSNSCASADSVLVDKVEVPKIKVIYDSVQCQKVTLTVENQKGVQFLWNDMDTSIVKSVDQKGIYIIEAKHQFCSSFDTLDLKFLSKPYFNLGNDTTLCGSKILSTNETGRFAWSTGQSTPRISVQRPGLYWLQVVRNQCAYRDSIQLSPCGNLNYFIPNSFSPNSDNKNEVFQITVNNIKEIEFTVFNRWGEIMFQSSSDLAEWDGKYQGEVCPQGVYYFYATFIAWNGQIVNEKGSINLLR